MANTVFLTQSQITAQEEEFGTGRPILAIGPEPSYQSPVQAKDTGMVSNASPTAVQITVRPAGSGMADLRDVIKRTQQVALPMSTSPERDASTRTVRTDVLRTGLGMQQITIVRLQQIQMEQTELTGVVVLMLPALEEGHTGMELSVCPLPILATAQLVGFGITHLSTVPSCPLIATAILFALEAIGTV